MFGINFFKIFCRTSIYDIYDIFIILLNLYNCASIIYSKFRLFYLKKKYFIFVRIMIIN